MIPKIIHYCWFGRGQLPPLALKCIQSWKKYCPDYEIKEWNEDNFDLDLFPYVREAYDNKKYAFVTDVVRLYALLKEGGVYMDTDVEVIKPIDQFLCHHAFSGFENQREVPTGIMASEKGGKWVAENLAYYNDRHFILPNGQFDITPNVKTITRLLLQHGLVQNNTLQDFADLVTMYPKDFFCPKNPDTGEIFLTNNTCTIHHFNGSWWPDGSRFRRKLIYRGLPPVLAELLVQCIYLPKHIILHMINGTFWQQVKKRFNRYLKK